MEPAHLDVRAEYAADRPWVVVCNTVGVPHAVFDRLLDTLADSFSVLCWSTALTEGGAPHGRPLAPTAEELVAEATRTLRRSAVREFVGISWCSGTEILHRLSRSGDFRVTGHCCVNGAFNLGPDGPSSDWERGVEPLFRRILARPEILPGVSTLLKASAETATEGGHPALEFPYSTPERVLGYAAQCLEMKRSRTFEGFVDSDHRGLYLSGSQDGVQPSAVSRTAAARSGATFEAVEGGRHAMMADFPRVCERLRQYCEAVSPRPGGR